MSTNYRLPRVNLKFWRLCGISLDGTRIDAVEAGCLDFPAIDTGMENYRNYFQDNLRLLRPVGLVAIDNTPWPGGVAYPGKPYPETRAISVLNAFIFRQGRVDMRLLPVTYGLASALKERAADPAASQKPAYRSSLVPSSVFR